MTNARANAHAALTYYSMLLADPEPDADTPRHQSLRALARAAAKRLIADLSRIDRHVHGIKGKGTS